MAKNYLQEGNAINFKNTGLSAIESGSVVVAANMVGIAAGKIEPSGAGVLYLKGVFEVPKLTHATNQAMEVGESVFWKAADKKAANAATTALTGDARGWGIVVEAASSTSASVKVRLTGAAATISA